jgi:hypothetical protein
VEARGRFFEVRLCGAGPSKCHGEGERTRTARW